MFIGEQLWLYPIQFSLFPLLTSPFAATQKILSVIRKYEITEPVFLPKIKIHTSYYKNYRIFV